jgi:para-nitrobenzyl esterase
LNAFRDLVFWNLHSWARLQTARGTARAYLYFFTRGPPSTPGQPWRGASHTAELPYAFNNLHLERNQTWTDTDRRLAELMSSYWVNFAASGDPNGPGLPAWPRFAPADDRSVMILGDTAGAGTAPDARVRPIYDMHYGVDRLLRTAAQPATR